MKSRNKFLNKNQSCSTPVKNTLAELNRMLIEKKKAKRALKKAKREAAMEMKDEI